MIKLIYLHPCSVRSKMNRRQARHYVESPDRWAEQSRGRVQAEAICAFEAVTRAMLPFPRGESWGVNKLAPGSEGKPSWWSSLPETFTIHSTYLTETRPNADKSGARETRIFRVHTSMRYPVEICSYTRIFIAACATVFCSLFW